MHYFLILINNKWYRGDPRVQIKQDMTYKSNQSKIWMLSKIMWAWSMYYYDLEGRFCLKHY